MDDFEYPDVPSKKEISETLMKMYHRKKIEAPEKSHPIRTTFITLGVIIILLAGGLFTYSQFTNQSVGTSTTGAVTGLSDFSSILTGLFVEEKLPPEEERFGIKITGKQIDLLKEEKDLQTGLITNYTSKCSQEKLDVKQVTETKIKTVCEQEKAIIQSESDSWETKYENCMDNDD